MMPLSATGSHVGRGAAGSHPEPAVRGRTVSGRTPKESAMLVNITFRHLEPTEALKSHVKDKVAHVQRYVDRPTEAHAVLHVENLDHHADITLKAGTFFLRGRARSEDMYASIDLAVNKIERQLKKHKEKLKNHKATVIPHGWVPVEVRHEVFPVESPADRIVKSSRFQAKPMSLDEAILQMELLESRFYVFQNAGSHAINVVYRREDGNLGVIEARSS
jgi:putative sigma-54 modulation protein